VRNLFAAGDTMIEFSPSGVTKMMALPVGASTTRRPCKSTPAPVNEARRSSPWESAPMQPKKATSNPRRPAATA
jgi:hypothetical protein